MKTFSRCPPLATMFSAVFEPAQLESWLMSILAGLGAAPSNFTVPLTLAAVAGSIGVAAGPAAGADAGCSSVVSFLPQPAINATPNKTNTLQMASDCFVFILFLPLPLRYQKLAYVYYVYYGTRGAAPAAALSPVALPPVAARPRPIDALTRRCSSGVSWKMYSTRSLV